MARQAIRCRVCGKTADGWVTDGIGLLGEVFCPDHSEWERRGKALIWRSPKRRPGVKRTAKAAPAKSVVRTLRLVSDDGKRATIRWRDEV